MPTRNEALPLVRQLCLTCAPEPTLKVEYHRGDFLEKWLSSRTRSLSCSETEPEGEPEEEMRKMQMLYASPLCFHDGRHMKALPQIPRLERLLNEEQKEPLMNVLSLC